MADMIARLKVDSSEYDAKIQRAAKGIQHLAEECHNAGSILNVLEDENREYIKSLGNMATVATTTRGKIAELTSGFIDIKSVYNSLSDEEKKGEFGKELNKQLDIMKGRITDAKKELADINKELEQTDTDGKNLGGVIDQLAGKFGLSTKSLVGWGAAIGAAKAALDVAKDAFFANDEQLDEWGRTVESASSLYDGFLNALNTGDISGYLSRIGEITQAARDAYNALDDLSTFNAFSQINVEKTRTGMTEAIVDYREGKGTKDQVRAAGDAYKKELQERKRLEKDAYIEAVGKVAAERGVSKQDLLDALSGTYGNYQDLKNVQMTGERIVSYGGGMFGGGGTYTEKYAKTQQEKLGEALRHLNDTELQSLQALGAQAQRTGNEIAQVDKQLVRVLNGRQGSGTGSGSGKTGKTYDEGIKLGKGMEGLTGATIVTYESMEDLQRQLTAYKTALNRATNAIDEQAARQGIAATEWKMSDVGRSAAKLGWSQEDMTSEVAKMQDALGNIEPLKIEAHIEADTKGFSKDAADMAKEWNAAGKAINAVGAAMSQIEDPAAKVLGTIAQAVATMALSYAQAADSPAVTGTGWGWIAFAATGLATMLTSISAIKNATSGFASGGIIPGNSYSGDNLRGMTPDGNVYGLNAGELILNKAQQNNIASDLQRNDQKGATAQPYVSGEQIFLGLNNYLRRTGRGELVTSH